MSQSNSNKVTWLLIGAVIAIGGRFASNLIWTAYSDQSLSLQFSMVETIPFRGDDGYTGIYNVWVNNNGKTFVEDVTLIINIENAMIEEYKIGINPAIEHDVTSTNQNITCKFTILNPNEVVSISVLAFSNTELPNRPDVILRGKGVNGKEIVIPSLLNIQYSESAKYPWITLSMTLVILTSTILLVLHEKGYIP